MDLSLKQSSIFAVLKFRIVWLTDLMIYSHQTKLEYIGFVIVSLEEMFAKGDSDNMT